ncbi:MAG: hypothetical protein MK175_18350 [Pseudoalteromonas sp.]|uniref:hypothetical protein n=1 Tax=Pseudoalteromonas sp. TaxID=53249 RepID=UPI0025E7C939|nr:hypothetical protein [Pseudoalteromonas sp.]MCH2089149.1 hypothetical protein [Pseudoalteromonas sp.]
MAAITNALIDQDSSQELQDECSAHLDSLMALGNAKSQYYAEKINTSLLGAGQGTDKTFPITTIQSFIYETKAYTSDNAENISAVVNDSIRGFISGDTQSAVTSLISGFVDILFGSSEGSESEILRYCAILEGASMIRLDFAGWSRQITSTSLKQKCDKVSAFVVYRSIVDMSKVTLNDFIAVYQVTVKAENPELGTADVLKKCKELYYLFNPESAGLVEASSPSLVGKDFSPKKGYDSFDVFKQSLTTL